MKKIILICFALFLTMPLFAQDLLIKRNGQRIYAIVRQLSPKKVTFQVWGQPYAPLCTLKTQSLWGIQFENGRLIQFEELWDDDDDDDDEHKKIKKYYKKREKYYKKQHEHMEELMEEALEHRNPYKKMIEEAEERREEWEEAMEERHEDWKERREECYEPWDD